MTPPTNPSEHAEHAEHAGQADPFGEGAGSDRAAEAIREAMASRSGESGGLSDDLRARLMAAAEPGLEANRAGRGLGTRLWSRRIGVPFAAAAAVLVVSVLVVLQLGPAGGGAGPALQPESRHMPQALAMDESVGQRAPAREGPALAASGLAPRALDINRDGAVDILDARALAVAARAGTNTADVNEDGSSDEDDARWLARHVVRLEASG